MCRGPPPGVSEVLALPTGDKVAAGVVIHALWLSGACCVAPTTQAQFLSMDSGSLCTYKAARQTLDVHDWWSWCSISIPLPTHLQLPVRLIGGTAVACIAANTLFGLAPKPQLHTNRPQHFFACVFLLVRAGCVCWLPHPPPAHPHDGGAHPDHRAQRPPCSHAQGDRAAQ